MLLTIFRNVTVVHTDNSKRDQIEFTRSILTAICINIWQFGMYRWMARDATNGLPLDLHPLCTLAIFQHRSIKSISLMKLTIPPTKFQFIPLLAPEQNSEKLARKPATHQIQIICHFLIQVGILFSVWPRAHLRTQSHNFILLFRYMENVYNSSTISFGLFLKWHR